MSIVSQLIGLDSILTGKNTLQIKQIKINENAIQIIW